MITISIGTEQRRFEDASEEWIAQQLRRRRDDNVTPCITIAIEQPPLNMILQTPGCISSAKSSSSSRPPTSQEKQIFDLWERMGLNDARYTAGNLVAFLKQLRRGT